LAIEAACWKKALVLNARNVREEEKKSQHVIKKTYRSIGTLVVQFKKHVRNQVAQYKDAKNIHTPLMERSEVEALKQARGSQTPEGNKSMYDFYSTNKK